MRLSLNAVLSALGQGHSPAAGEAFIFEGISTDTRSLKPGELFVALSGPNSNGHHFVPAAIRAGARGLVVSEQVVASLDTAILRVPDTTVAYGMLARAWRDKFDIPVIGVTGSVGKTTTKEMLAAALSPLGPVLKTEASQNNETGVPKTLLGLDESHRSAVIEMGMRGPGQIADLCAIARPTVGVITRISDNHIGLLGSREAIADAKAELISSLSENDLAVLNADDPFYPRIAAKSSARVVTYGVENTATFRAEEIGRSGSGWSFKVGGIPIRLPSPSSHDISNALAALSVAISLGIEPAVAAAALEVYVAPPMRMEVIAVPSWGGVVLNDAYNAAPASMRSAIETLFSYPGGRRIAFLGDMKELGDTEHNAHKELGNVIDSLGTLDALYTVGPLATAIPNAARRFADSEEAAQFAGESLELAESDVILVKGSHAMTMEIIVERLRARTSASIIREADIGKARRNAH